MVKSLVESHHGERATKLIFADRLERFPDRYFHCCKHTGAHDSAYFLFH